jgi:hypothetical protein
MWYSLTLTLLKMKYNFVFRIKRTPPAGTPAGGVEFVAVVPA